MVLRINYVFSSFRCGILALLSKLKKGRPSMLSLLLEKWFSWWITDLLSQDRVFFKMGVYLGLGGCKFHHVIACCIALKLSQHCQPRTDLMVNVKIIWETTGIAFWSVPPPSIFAVMEDWNRLSLVCSAWVWPSSTPHSCWDLSTAHVAPLPPEAQTP